MYVQGSRSRSDKYANVISVDVSCRVAMGRASSNQLTRRELMAHQRGVRRGQTERRLLAAVQSGTSFC